MFLTFGGTVLPTKHYHPVSLTRVGIKTPRTFRLLKGTLYMQKLLTRGEVCERLRISYSTLCRMMNAGGFISPVNGRGRKLLFDPDALETWIKARQSPVTTPTITSPTQQKRQDKEKQQRLAEARKRLEMHRKPK
jgi:excisionase family DNA binding protein